MIRFISFIEKCQLGGLAKGKTPEDLAKKHQVSIDHIKTQLDMGSKVEIEHTKDHSAALKIAMDHVFEDPNYYTKLKKMESENANTTASGIAGVSPGEPTVVKRNGQGLLFGRRKLRRRSR
jgi:hypothetical protein